MVILGQDPYHTPGKANGLAFGYHPLYGGPLDASLRNIFAEVERCTGQVPIDRTLYSWARQGVLLLNTVLTTEPGQPRVHHLLGWQELVIRCLQELDDTCQPVAYMLWGQDAQRFRPLIRNPDAKILTASHPSPLSAHISFMGCGHFAKVNRWLSDKGLTPIQWGEPTKEDAFKRTIYIDRQEYMSRMETLGFR